MIEIFFNQENKLKIESLKIINLKQKRHLLIASGTLLTILHLDFLPSLILFIQSIRIPTKFCWKIIY